MLTPLSVVAQAGSHPYFPGVLLGALRRHYQAPSAGALAAVPFTLWHTALALEETPSRNLTHLALSFAGYYLAGVGFGALRETTRTLSSCLAAHWTLNATLMLLLHPTARRGATTTGAALLPGACGSIEVGTTLFFALLLTLIVTLFDRYQPIHLARGGLDR